ncbi:MAG: nuclear transport factor 2 family protein [Pseudomonadota bacterium]
MNPFEAIEDVLVTYFEGLHYSDTERLAAVFHPRAIYATADEHPTLVRDMDDYLSVVATRESPAARGEARHDAIDAIELAGPNTALARVRCAIGSRRFVDFLTLVREHGRWRIMAKVFQIIEDDGKQQETSPCPT